jgi:phosphosulfolactate synthase
MSGVWERLLEAPLAGRQLKPRKTGITMLIDKGLTVHESRDLLSLNAPFFDFLKLTFGTAVLYPQSVLREKIDLAKRFEVAVYPGGTLFEIALWQGKSEQYFWSLLELGFQWVEISDGSLTISPTERAAAIQTAQRLGLKVITEVGKKDAGNQPSGELLAETARRDFEEGAEWVIIEGRESGKGIGIYDQHGGIIVDKFELLSHQLKSPEKIIWEAPLKAQQALLINEFGPNVSLGNIPPQEIMALEALRRGYRSDTWKI